MEKPIREYFRSPFGRTKKVRLSAVTTSNPTKWKGPPLCPGSTHWSRRSLFRVKLWPRCRRSARWKMEAMFRERGRQFENPQRRRAMRCAWLLFLCCTSGTYAHADLKAHIVTHVSRNDPQRGKWEKTTDEFIFISGDNLRTTSAQGNLVVVMHCGDRDRRRYQMDMLRKEYTDRKFNYPADDTVGSQAKASGTVASKTEDTGETREFFGRKARHLITHIRQTRGNTTTEVTQDGWYIGLRWPAHKCPFDHYNRAGIGPTVNYTDNSVVFAHVGPMPDGPAVKFVENFTIRTINAAGEAIETTGSAMTEILELSEAPLDPALFKPPREFKKVRMLVDEIIQQENAIPAKTRH